ncbi:ATP phosphoribosyltransferase [Acuticoccus sp. MNP-M23]|uniref:ATP phosphoribosyltransferase n=1 Tax=Acuticoccus sp. MNP-M23 TaxID=3072793 RepID=UPI002815A27E|nr:ATP phosphoribosyltransferase [Acuticoccus sp. MNP-M23]WMS44114.1 ATP phosphoribosyltransferase [Acuticoccus sp. MNP-M23]
MDLVLAAPSKGRLQEIALDFLTRAGMKVERARGGRDYRGRIAGLPGVQVAFLSASEIARELSAGNAHLGLTGLDLLHEAVDDTHERNNRFHVVTPLGFSRADVVVAVPERWIDVETMADLADVAEFHRARHGRTLRVATKFVNLTRRFFAAAGVVDYRIVESLGATEGAPASGAADLIVDITTTGATLAANQLKILSDGLILSSEAQFVASLAAPWCDDTRAMAATIVDRIAAEMRAQAVLELRAVMPNPAAAARDASSRFDAIAPFGSEPVPLTLHVARRRASDCASWLRAEGAATVVTTQVADIYEENVFSRDLLARLATV